MDTLVELPIEKWSLLQEKLKKLWPLNVAGYYALQLNKNYPNVRETFQFKVYCPEGNLDNGFISINVKNSQDIILFSTTEDTSKLEESLRHTKLIDWSQKICIDLVNSLILESLNRIRPLMNFSLYEVGMVKTFYLTKESKPFEELRIIPNAYIGPVKEENLAHIDDVWPYKFPGSQSYFATFVSNGLSYGLYFNDELVSWVFVNEYNFLLHLYCEEKYRRQGFGEYILKIAINEQLQQGNDVYAYVVQGNDKPIALFKKLGFEIIDDGAYIMAQK